VALAAMLVLTLMCSATFAAPRPSHFWLCAHHDWAAKKGYFLVLENTFDDGAPSKLADARLVLAVGDGNDFRYLRGTTPFALDRDYSAKAISTADSAELFIDGKQVAKSDGGFA